MVDGGQKSGPRATKWVINVKCWNAKKEEDVTGGGITLELVEIVKDNAFNAKTDGVEGEY